MRTLYLNSFIELIGGRRISGDPYAVISHVATQARKIKDHTLYFDLGRQKDTGVFANYRSPVIITADPERFASCADNGCIVQTADTMESYWRFVQYYRSLFTLPVIGITGTSGKTTTKEMLTCILSRDFTVHSTHKSKNGIALNLDYLTGINDDTDVAVFEMGVSWPENLVDSIRHFRPQVRVLLNIGVNHLQGCKTPEKYFAAKAKITYDYNPATDVLIINADDENCQKIDVRGLPAVLRFGIIQPCDFQATEIAYSDGGMTFILQHEEKRHRVFVPGYGRHTVYNALAALAAATRAGLEITAACRYLADFRQMTEHLEYHAGRGGCTVIDDTWNNSPPAMAAALDVLKNTAQGRKKVALLGYMPQLGQGRHAQEQYKQMGIKAAEAGLDLLVIAGDYARGIGTAAITAGLCESRVHFCTDGAAVYRLLEPFLTPHALILLKTSHRQMREPSFAALKKLLFNKQ